MPMATEIFAKIILDSISPEDKRLTTIHLRYPRFIHTELMTHRVFSRNARSSRAVPVKTLLAEMASSAVVPLHWGKNQKGMQADYEINELIATSDIPVVLDAEYVTREQAWDCGVRVAIGLATAFDKAGSVPSSTARWSAVFGLAAHAPERTDRVSPHRCRSPTAPFSDPGRPKLSPRLCALLAEARPKSTGSHWKSTGTRDGHARYACRCQETDPKPAAQMGAWVRLI